MLNIAISGDSTFKDYKAFEQKVNYYLSSIRHIRSKNVCIYCGNNNGTDKLAEKYAILNRYQLKRVEPNYTWKNRAKKMQADVLATCGKCVLIFWDGRNQETKQLVDSVNFYMTKARIIKHD